MRIAILGAGPAGLYSAYLLKRAFSNADIMLVEQNPAAATFDFGVVLSDRALDFLAQDDPGTHACFTPHMERWIAMACISDDPPRALVGRQRRAAR